MNAERLLAHYEKVANAPDAVVRLRRFILDLAVRGKLVSQDPNDEPASELLKRIANEKARLVNAGDIRKPRDFDSSNELDKPFAVPTTWRWVRLDAVGAIIGGGTPSAADPENFTEPGKGTPWLTPADLGGYSGLFIERGSRDLTEKGSRASSATLMPKGTVLFTSRAPIGYVAIAANPISTNQGFKSIVPYIPDCSRFIATAMTAFAPEIDAKAPGTTFKEVSGKIVAAIPFPLPPLAEQHRIAARVDELMGLCDRLEAARADRETVRDRLAAASLARLNAPEAAMPSVAASASYQMSNVSPEIRSPTFTALLASNASKAFSDHARFALDALPALTARPDQIEALRQTILNLAVRGKLVSQSASEELASDLLNQIANEKLQPKDEKSCNIAIPFDCPQGWAWTVVQNVLAPGRDISYGVIKLGDIPKSGGISTLRCSDVRPGHVDLSNVRKVSESIEADYIRTRLFGGEIVINIRGTLGGVALVGRDLRGYNVAREVAVVPISEKISGHYMVYLMLSPYFWNQIQSNLRGIAYKGLNLGILREIPIPLPPLAEQHRIVVKVDALMALCDKLEASLTAAADTRRRLLDALLAGALAPDEDRLLEAAE